MVGPGARLRRSWELAQRGRGLCLLRGHRAVVSASRMLPLGRVAGYAQTSTCLIAQPRDVTTREPMFCGAATTEAVECQLESLYSEPVQHDVELRQVLGLTQGPQRLRLLSRQMPQSCAQHQADASAVHQYVLVCGVSRQTSRFRTADADKTVDTRVPSLLGCCEAVQVTPLETTLWKGGSGRRGT